MRSEHGAGNSEADALQGPFAARLAEAIHYHSLDHLGHRIH